MIFVHNGKIAPAKLSQDSVYDNWSCRNRFFYSSIASGSECTQEVCTGFSPSALLGYQVAEKMAKMPLKSQKCGFVENLKMTLKVRTEPTYFYGILRVLYGYLREVNLRVGHIRGIIRVFTGYTVDYGLQISWVNQNIKKSWKIKKNVKNLPNALKMYLAPHSHGLGFYEKSHWWFGLGTQPTFFTQQGNVLLR